MAEKIGGFFADLKLLVDNSSFGKGIKALSKVGATLKEIGGATKKAFAIGAGISAFAGMMSFLENKNYNVATSLGISVTEMKNFKYAADLAGVSGDSFVDTMQSIVDSSREFQTKGIVNDTQLTGLQKLGGVSLQNLVMGEEDVTEKIKAIYSAAKNNINGLSNPQIKQALQDALGKPGLDLYNNLKDSNVEMDQLVDSAKDFVLTTNQSNKEARDLSRKMAGIKIIAEEFGERFSGGFASGIMPGLDFNNIGKGTLQQAGAETEQFGKDLGGMIKQAIPLVIPMLKAGMKAFTLMNRWLTGLIGTKSEKEALMKEDAENAKVEMQTKILPKMNKEKEVQYNQSSDQWHQALSNVMSDISSGRFKNDISARNADIKVLMSIKDQTDNGLKITSEIDKSNYLNAMKRKDSGVF